MSGHAHHYIICCTHIYSLTHSQMVSGKNMLLVFVLFVQILKTSSQIEQLQKLLSRHPSEEDIREVMYLTENSTDTLEYRSIFDQLLYCPLVPLCNNLTRADTYSSDMFNDLVSCCSQCSCSKDGKQNGGQCPNSPVNTTLSDKTCIRPQYLMYDQTQVNVELSYYMIHRCSLNFKDQIVIDKCLSDEETYNSLDLSLYVPVTTINGDVLYKNRHFAICNNLDTDKIVNWEVEMRCVGGISFSEHPTTQAELLKKIKRSEKCNLVFRHSTMFPFKCDWGKYTKCNQTGDWINYDEEIERACNSYTSVYIDKYKNVFCFVCNRNTLPFMGCTDDDFVIGLPGGFGTFSGPIRYRTAPVPQTMQQCQENEIYDTHKEICRQVFCPQYFIYNSTDCEPMFDEVSSVKYETIYNVKIRGDISCVPEGGNILFSSSQRCMENSAERAISTLVRYIENIIQGSMNCAHNTEVYILMSDVLENINTFIIKLEFVNLMSHNPQHYINALTSVPEMNTTLGNITLFITSKVVSKTEFDMIIDKILPIPILLPPVFSFSCVRDLDVVYVMSDYYCPRIQYHIDEVNISDTKLILPSLNISYNIESIVRSGNHVTVCLDSYLAAMSQSTNKTVSTDDEVEEILSFICSIVSIISLICTLIVYSVFKELRTLPGINNMILAGHLIVANVLYLFGFKATSNDNLCVALGMLTHYFWLSAIMWMHVCSIHMFRVFFFMRKGPGIKQSKRVILFYSIYVISVSVLMVCVNVIHFLTGQSDVSGYLGYGGNRCYITIPTMILYTFAIPVGSILLSNIALFCLVVFRIEKLPDVKSSSGKSRNTFVIYIKLTCLTGLSWIFGFVYQWTLVTALSYIFIILNASQGLFIFLSFGCSKRVRNMCRMKFAKGDNSKLSSTKQTPHSSPATKKSLIIESESIKLTNQSN